ncbi:uncharacterized protein B0I36DRAFT_218956, partial [Microdochium trichocladiopsis]
LESKRSLRSFENALNSLENGGGSYEAAYTNTMERIKCQMPDQRETALKALMWTAFCRRPLKALELQHALATEPDATEFDSGNITPIDDIVSACAGLLTVSQGTSVVTLVHYTTQEFLERAATRWFSDAHADILRTCITYMSY